MSGLIVSTLERRLGVAGATLTSAAGNTTTNADGMYGLIGSASAPLRVTIAAPGYVTRETGIYVTAGHSRVLNLDIIAVRPPFDETLWNELARGAYDNHGQLGPLMRWTGDAPVYWLKTTDDRGTPLAPATIAKIKSTIVATVEDFTGSRLTPIVTETTQSIAGRPSGAIAVDAIYDTNPARCGEAAVGALTGGYIRFYVGSTRCSCSADTMNVETFTIAHETGHTIGLFHTSNPADLMNNISPACDITRPTMREIYHAFIMFQRQRGNTAPDVDPQSTTLAQAESGQPLVCRLKTFRRN